MSTIVQPVPRSVTRRIAQTALDWIPVLPPVLPELTMLYVSQNA